MDTNNKRITNSDIYQELGAIKQIALATKDQAERTNGRVTKLEKWQNGVVAVETYADKHKSDGSVDYTKIVLAALGLVGTALAIITVMVSK